jgi:hypothetical protein
MSTKCPGKLPPKKPRKSTFWVGLGKLELDPVFEVGLGELVLEPVFEVSLGELVLEPSFYETTLAKMEIWDTEMQAWINLKGEKRYEAGFKEKVVESVREALATSGLQTAISNGLEGIRTMNSIDRKLFE